MFKGVASRALGVFALFTVVCGLGYTLVVTGIAQVAFPYRANGSLIKVDGKLMAYGAPSNLSPASEEYRQLVDARVKKIRAANPDADTDAVPVDLVTCSGSGLDPEISPDAAEYQVPRLAKATGKSEGEVRDIIAQCTKGRFLGVFGEPTVNVLKVNLMLDGTL